MRLSHAAAALLVERLSRLTAHPISKASPLLRGSERPQDVLAYGSLIWLPAPSCALHESSKTVHLQYFEDAAVIMVASYIFNCTHALASALLIGLYGGLMLSLRECQTEVAHAKRGHVSRMPSWLVEDMAIARRAVALLQERVSGLLL